MGWQRGIFGPRGLAPALSNTASLAEAGLPPVTVLFNIRLTIGEN
jgi:hypothetical protein